jgi:hypothetical protein
MATKIIHKKSSVAASVPVSADIAPGELALNLADQKIYTKQTDGTIIEMAPNIDQKALTENCKNVSGGTLTAGTVVYQSGTAGNAMEVQAADSTNPAKMPAIGVIQDSLASGAEGKLVLVGFIQHVDTSSFSEGETLYVNTGGDYQNTVPTGSGTLIQNIGKVIKVHASNGSIMVTGAGRANATPNLDEGTIFLGNSSGQAITEEFKLGKMTDVEDYTTPEAGDVLVWSAANSQWEVTTPSQGTVTENLTNWEFESGATWDISEASNNLYFAFGGVNKMKVDGSGNLQVVGDVESNATISGGSSTSLYFTLSETKYLELDTSGNLFVSGNIDSLATIT